MLFSRVNVMSIATKGTETFIFYFREFRVFRG
jgi:hypothetical protein